MALILRNPRAQLQLQFVPLMDSRSARRYVMHLSAAQRGAAGEQGAGVVQPVVGRSFNNHLLMIG
jgi:hypothetical protein